LKVEFNMSVFKKSFVLLLLIICFSPFNANAEKNLTIGFFPFDTYAHDDIKSLGNKLPLMIADEVKKAEAQTIFIDSQKKDTDFNPERFKEIGIENGVDYLISGSIFEAGDRISIDIKMVDIYKDVPEKSFFVQINGVENLYSAVGELSKKIISEVFQKKIIAKIEIKGNERIEDDAILRAIDLKPKDIVDSGRISSNIKNIYKLGYFEDVKAEKEKLDTGVKIIFRVAERPSVRMIKFKGNVKFEEKELSEVVTTSTGSILNIFKINRDGLIIKELYKTKNYHNCQVKYEIKKLKNNQADILFNVDEGRKLRIEEISFEGNNYFDDNDLLDEIEIKEKGIFSLFSSSGDLDRAELERDVVRLESFYKNNGFIDASVSEPEIKYGENSILIHFEIKEGLQYKINKIYLEGDLISSEKILYKKLKTDNLKFFSRDTLKDDLATLHDIYNEKGFAKPEISPVIERNSKEKFIDITFVIKKGLPIYFGRITIKGNSRTRDKVIRRQLKAIETELFTKKKLQKSLRNLQRLDYFKDVKIQPTEGSNENLMDLNIDVIEKPTGNLSFGAGYSTTKKAFGFIELSEGNLFGRGQVAKVKTELSDSSVLFSLKYIEPWLFDIPLSFTSEAYNLENEYDHYDKDSKGASLGLSYPVFENTRVGIKYEYEDFTIKNVKEALTTVDAGDFLTTSITPSITYDSRDRLFVPRKGIFTKFSVQYADDALGGDISFTKSILEVGVYIPLFWKFTWVLHGKGGYLDDRTDGNPDIDYERFYLGGINSIRGFDSGDIYATFVNGEERGGEKLIQLNTELTFPIIAEQGLFGVFFYDQGDVFLENQDVTLSDNYSSFGFGVRWDSPLGPMRLEYGIVGNGRNIEEQGDGRFQFSVGARF
jgi:outer membrane protein insertion porin family